MNSPAEDIMDMLDTTSVGAGVGEYAVDLFVNVEPTKPDACITVYDTGGFKPDPEPDRMFHPTVQVRVRGSKGGAQAAYTTIAAVQAAIHSTTNETWNGSRYLYIFAMNEPMPLGNDDNERPIYVINFRMARTAV